MIHTGPLTEHDAVVFDGCAPLRSITPPQRDGMRAAAKVSCIDAGTVIIEEGSAGETFHVLLDGVAEVIGSRNGRTVHLADLRRGDYFGELAMMSALGRRAATVRAVTMCRIATLAASDFHAGIASEVQNRERFESAAAHYLHRPVTDSLREFATRLQEAPGGLERLSFADGEVVMHEGAQSDAVYLILAGVAIATKGSGGTMRELARMGADQLFGEHGVLHGEPRAATIKAAGPLELLRIDAETFLKWHGANPSADGLFKSLARVYTLAQQRRMTILLGEADGKPSVTSLAGEPGHGVVSTKIIGGDSIVFHNPAAGRIEGEREELRYADDRFTRLLRVIVLSRRNGVIERCIVYAVRATGIESDLGTLYQHVQDLQEVHAPALKRFQRTGYLGGTAPRTDRLCACLGLGPEEIDAAAGERGSYSYEKLQADIGVGSVCGGCDRAVRAYLSTAGKGQTTRVSIMDVPMDSLSDEERQLAGLIARGLGTGNTPVTRQQLAVRLRATGIRDMEAFIDQLFPDVFATATQATPSALAAAVGRGAGFVPWRRIALQPRPWAKRVRHHAVLAIYHLGRKGVLMSLLAIMGVTILLDPLVAAIGWLIVGLAALVAWTAFPDAPTKRFLLFFATGGPSRYYRALWKAFGDETGLGILRDDRARPTYFIRDERLVDEVLQRPDIHARQALWEYPPFGAHSTLGGGSSGVWLGYRLLFEEYFSETYREDLDLMRAVVRERMAQLKDRGSIMLLDELYRIVLELRARVFFQGTFGCFADDPGDRFVAAVDRILGPEVQLFNSMAGGDVQLVRERIRSVLNGSTRPGSIGAIIRDAERDGVLNTHEALENAAMYTLAQAPTMGLFWTIYRTARMGTADRLRADRREMVKAIKEELRLHPPVTSLFQREVLRDTRLGDIDMRAGSRVNLCPMYIHTNPAQWTSPMEFDPSRWEVHAGDSSEIVDPKTDPSDSASSPPSRAACPHAQRYMPFGGGAQACQGRWFAADEMLLILEEVLTHFDLTVEEDHGLLDQPLPEQVLLHIYDRPANEVRLRLIPRS